MSVHLSPLYLDKAVNVFRALDIEYNDHDDNTIEIGRSIDEVSLDPTSEVFREREVVEILKRKALAAKEMQDLCLTIERLCGWRILEEANR